MLALIATEATLFAYLIFSYFYIASHANVPWPPGGAPHLRIAVPDTFSLIGGSVTMGWGERGIRQGSRTQLLIGRAATLALGILFISLQGREWSRQTFTPASGVYGSPYFTITGFHMAHVLVGLVILAVLFAWTAIDYFHANRHSAVSIGVIYRHFVTAVWLAVFFSILHRAWGRSHDCANPAVSKRQPSGTAPTSRRPGGTH